jgi:hypothetical protein
VLSYDTLWNYLKEYADQIRADSAAAGDDGSRFMAVIDNINITITSRHPSISVKKGRWDATVRLLVQLVEPDTAGYTPDDYLRKNMLNLIRLTCCPRHFVFFLS